MKFPEQLVARLRADNQFMEAVRAEREHQIKYLMGAIEPHMIHRAQGRLSLLEDMLKAVDAK